MAVLPVSGLEPDLRLPNGADELILCETGGSAIARSIAFLATLSDECDWSSLTVTDFEILLLDLRQRVLGEVCDLGFGCPHCGARVAVSFRIADFLSQIRSRRPAGVEEAPGRAGWFITAGTAFRLPTAADQAAVENRPDAVCRLAARCIDSPHPPARLRTRIERAMAAIAPEVSRLLAGVCPECGQAVEAALHVTRLVAGEFTREAAGLHDEIDLIARAYHWPEAEILRLPRQRRRAYAERIRQAA